MSLPIPYYQDEAVTIYNLDCRLILPDLAADAVVTDPPRGETSLKWDQWLPGWPSTLLGITKSLWVFGSLRMFTEREKEFAGWEMAQDIIWCKQNGTNAFNDRFRRVHEIAVQFYPKKCRWSEVYKKPLHTNDATARTIRRKNRPAQWGDIGALTYTSLDGGPRLMTSVIYARNCHGKALHPTEKPAAIISPLIE